MAPGSLIQTPGILAAVNPWYALLMFLHAPWVAFVSLGAVVLAVTGCEALYADMGHFGRKPIQYAWLFVALPALMLNYFGQGAALLRNPEQADIAFFSVIPHWAHMPMVVLATLAAIIASQAVITGVFSMTQQAVQLGQLPRMEIRHTSATDYGQIYVPRMNALPGGGRGADRADLQELGRADRRLWHRGDRRHGDRHLQRRNRGGQAVALAAPGSSSACSAPWGISDLLFFISNSLKIPEGGWLPLFIAACVFVMMDTWRRGRRVHLEKVRSESLPLSLFLERADKSTTRVAGSGRFPVVAHRCGARRAAAQSQAQQGAA